MKKIALIIGILFLLAGPAFATVWTADFLPEPSPLYMSEGDQQVMTFDITTAGFDHQFFWDLQRDIAMWYEVEIFATDDLSWEGFFGTAFDLIDFGSSGSEYMTLSTGWWGGDPETYEVGPGSDIYGDNILGLVSLNWNGILGINLTATGGDFLFIGARLTASDTAPVPEPATMLLLGTGLLGLVAFGRKRFKK